MKLSKRIRSPASLHSSYASANAIEGEDANGTKWVRQFGQILMTAWLELWDLRNKERHGRDEEERKAKRVESLRKQLEELYSLKTKVLQADRSIFLFDADTHMKLSPNLDGLEDWINTFGDGIRNSVKENLDIRNHFFRRGNQVG